MGTFLVVVAVVFVFSIFRVVAQVFTAMVARGLGADPTPFLPEPESRVKDTLVLLLFFVVSMFTVWFTRL